MRLSRSQYRMLYASLVIISFFLPSYGSLSAFSFILAAIETLKFDGEVTVLDLVVVLIPLLLIPFTAGVILLKAAKKQYLNSILLSTPFLSIAFFFLILLVLDKQANNLGLLEVFRQMRVGFYLAILSSFLLLMTQSKREALNYRTL